MKKTLFILAAVAVLGFIGTQRTATPASTRSGVPSSVLVYRRQLAEYRRWMAQRRRAERPRVRTVPFTVIVGKGRPSG